MKTKKRIQEDLLEKAFAYIRDAKGLTPHIILDYLKSHQNLKNVTRKDVLVSLKRHIDRKKLIPSPQCRFLWNCRDTESVKKGQDKLKHCVPKVVCCKCNKPKQVCPICGLRKCSELIPSDEIGKPKPKYVKKNGRPKKSASFIPGDRNSDEKPIAIDDPPKNRIQGKQMPKPDSKSIVERTNSSSPSICEPWFGLFKPSYLQSITSNNIPSGFGSFLEFLTCNKSKPVCQNCNLPKSAESTRSSFKPNNESGKPKPKYAKKRRPKKSSNCCLKCRKICDKLVTCDELPKNYIKIRLKPMPKSEPNSSPINTPSPSPSICEPCKGSDSQNSTKSSSPPCPKMKLVQFWARDKKPKRRRSQSCSKRRLSAKERLKRSASDTCCA